MSLTWRIPPTFLDAVENKRVERAKLLLKLESPMAIESYTMSPDGPMVTSVFIVNDMYICEVRLTTKDFEFDATSINELINYRVKFGEVAKPEIDASSIGLEQSQANLNSSVKFVEVSLRHTDTLLTKVSYFGEDVDDWLAFFLKAVPKEVLLPCSAR